MKKIYWIDDNMVCISYYVQGIIRKLWGDKNEKGISSVIRVFGDGYKESSNEEDWKKSDLEALMEEIQNNMADHCLNLEGWNWGTENSIYEQKMELIDDVLELVDMKQEEISKLVARWRSLEEKTEKGWKNDSFDVEMIRKYFKIPRGASVAIDLVLIRGDKERISKGIPVISMMLYDRLTSAGHTCILYSTFMYDSLFIDNWKDVYNQNKTENLPPVEEIYAGRQMWQKAKREDIIIRLKEIAKEIEEEVNNTEDEYNTEDA